MDRHYLRPLLILIVGAVLLVGALLLAPRPKPPAVSNTPLAPVQAIQQAKDAAALSDAANARIQAASGGGQVAAP